MGSQAQVVILGVALCRLLSRSWASVILEDPFQLRIF